MIWKAKWPFKSREHALVHEQAYLAGSYTPLGSRPIRLVDRQDLEIEGWLESGGAERLRGNTRDTDVIRKIWLWKMRSTIEATGGCADAPTGIFSGEFAESLGAVIRAKDDSEMAGAIDALVAFNGIAVRAASAFIYWLRPRQYQVIDRRATAALNLYFAEHDFTSDNYLRYCALSRDLQKEHNLSLRQIDRALFTFQKLLDRNEPIAITI